MTEFEPKNASYYRRELKKLQEKSMKTKEITQWAHDRNLIEGGSVDRQFLKLVEETGELAAGLARNDHAEVVDAIGDIVVVLTILAEQLNTDIETCVEHAWDEIKDRKGRLVNGIFIKEME